MGRHQDEGCVAVDDIFIAAASAALPAVGYGKDIFLYGAVRDSGALLVKGFPCELEVNEVTGKKAFFKYLSNL